MGKIDQRKDSRYEFDELATMSLEGLPSTRLVVRVLDISRVGLRIRASLTFTVGSRVEVVLRGVKVFGQIKYSRNLGEEGFNLGIQADRASDGAEVPKVEMDLTVLFGRH